MCGITGLWCAESVTEDRVRRWIERMTDTLAHRGPDAAGIFFERETGVGFGHRRLSILDLSSRGQQPMRSHSGRYCIAYNGEVYNAPEIRTELGQQGQRIPWRGHSDTEVVLEAIAEWGLQGALERFDGMFAFALWDGEAKRVSLVRDRLGIKPLLYVRGSFGIAFASELQALYEFPPFVPRLQRAALASFLRYGVVPDSECIVEHVHKVKPGTVIRFDGPRAQGIEHQFWSAKQVASDGLSQPFEGSEQDAIEEVERLLRRSVRFRMRSDVPFGAFLSGGIDSSAVVAMMQEVAEKPVQTFCIGNTSSGYDESSHAQAVADHLRCEHHTLIAEPSDMLALVPEVAHHWDEPFADSSQVPTFLVSRLARQHVTVSLSGDGGDELFAGYNRHAWAPRLWSLANRLPQRARKAFGALQLVGTDQWDRAFRAFGLGDVVRLPGDKLHKVATLAEVDTAHQLYERLRSHWSQPSEVLARGTDLGPPPLDHHFDAPFAEQMLFYDLTQYLPDDILTKVDRASMAVSLEGRVPLLDHHLVELAWRLPMSWKIKGRSQKWILRQVLARHVPTELFDRPKTGFGVPIGQWLRGPLAEWAAELLDENAIEAEGIFDARTVAGTWKAHQAGHGNHEHQLWAVLMFQSWWSHNRKHIET
ncbi:MAG: asparagine synthase (glutamine-hydrolyzing) [Deltaproteobacteria bacterium]|nr:asparagine synthase (glutamine-hydrolyzing) [Deltaproteobacteria bacterium]